MSTGKCPSCDRLVTHVNAQEINVNAPAGNFYGISYLCPYCSVILSTGLDPLRVKNDIVNELLKKLR
ncbi:hypothetical protein QLH32_17635 [Acinetobacter corruptisaponis]|uniref:Uncharacterized protein n=1 Tax=Acinetobacter corruptisaponis TaxID=3045147 RepID=A0ABY8S2L3_9GAMM|nr:hypothetical protein [Acinetobacter sp. KCTC 92772]WHP05800.1 hypothetical protein QLH32_17635 [Acinetobacter sp. KCTC 92772]